MHHNVYAVNKVANELIEELNRAISKHPHSFNSAHEGYAVLLEEVDELWMEVIRQEKNMVVIRKEAIQVGAMAIRFVLDVCGG